MSDKGKAISAFVKSLMENKGIKFVGACVFGLIIVIAVITGLGMLSAIVSAILLVVIIYFGGIGELAGSVVVVVLTKMLLSEITQLIGIFFSHPKLDQLFAFISSTGYIQLIFIFFWFIYTMSVVTGSVQLFHVTSKNNIEVDAKKEKNESNAEA